MAIKVNGGEFINQYADRWTVTLTIEKATSSQVMEFMALCAQQGEAMLAAEEA